MCPILTRPNKCVLFSLLTGMNILFELRLMHMCPIWKIGHIREKGHTGWKYATMLGHICRRKTGEIRAEKNRTPFFHPCENRTPFFHPSPCENRTHFFSPVRIGHISKPCENRSHLFTSSPVRIGHTFWWTCTLSSLIGKKVVTHLHRFKCRKNPSDVTN